MNILRIRESYFHAIPFLALFLVLSWGCTAQATTFIDIMFVYDKTAATYAMAYGGIAAFSYHALPKLNKAISFNSLDIEFRIVHIMTVDYTTKSTPDAPFTDDYDALSRGTGAFADVHAARDNYGADLVAMFIDHGDAGGYVGIGCSLQNWSGSPSCAFTVNAIRAVLTSFTLAHEVGHNLGAGHAKNQPSEPGPSTLASYAAGWYYTDKQGYGYHTVMAYSNNTYRYDAPLFSDPLYNSLLYGGGDGLEVGHPQDGDNARLIRQTKDIIASYRPNGRVSYLLSVRPLGDPASRVVAQGEVTSDPPGIECNNAIATDYPLNCEVYFESGTRVTLTATPKSDFAFKGWRAYLGPYISNVNICEETAPTCSFTMTSWVSAYADFVETLGLYVYKAGTGSGKVIGAGIDCGSDCIKRYISGTSVTLTATAASGSTFTGWSGACTGTDDCTLTMDSSKVVTATFISNTNYPLTVSKTGTGSGYVYSDLTNDRIDCGGDCTASYPSGTIVTLLAAATNGSIFAGWGGACSGAGTCKLTMDAAKSVTAVFNSPSSTTYPLTVVVTGSGDVRSDPEGIACGAASCSASFSTGSSVTLYAYPIWGFIFTGWSGACSGTGNCTMTMDGSKVVTAAFTAAPTYTLTANKAGGGNGTVADCKIGLSMSGSYCQFVTGFTINCGTDCAENYISGELVILRATPADGSTFTGWSGACTGTGDCKVAMDATKSVTATFNGTPGLLLAGLTTSGSIWHTPNLTSWINIPGQLSQLQVGDLDGDGQADLAGLTSAGKIFYTTNRRTWTNIPGTLAQLVVGDLDGDGRDDLAGLAGAGQIYYTLNRNTWTNIPGRLSRLVTGDFDGNGKADLAGLTSAGQIFYTLNRNTWVNIPGRLSRLVTGDFNNDGRDDLAGLTGAGQIYYTLNRSTWVNIPGYLSRLVAGDLDGDGQADLAGLASDDSVWYTTSFSTWTRIPGRLGRLVAGDLNNDGRADLAGLAGNGTIWYTTNRSSWINIPGLLSRLAGDD